MMDISKIMRREKEAKAKVVSPPLPECADNTNNTKEEAEFRFSVLMQAETPPEENVPLVSQANKPNVGGSCDKLYGEAMALARRVLSKAEKGECIGYRDVENAVDSLLRELVSGNENLITSACSPSPDIGNYLLNHMVNVSILALAVGLRLQFNVSKLRTLGLAGFLHDIGISKVKDIVDRGGHLSGDDLKEVKKHPLLGVEILKSIPDTSQTVLNVVYEEHERLDGSGYPRGIRDPKSFDECSLIVAAVDVFEAVTHPRPHRGSIPPHETIKWMLSDEEVFKFDTSCLKALIGSVGIYPLGSWVKLTDNEVAKVIGLNHLRPLRPKVNVVFDRNGSKLKEARLLNLADFDAVQIAGPLTDDELKILVEQVGL